jgi:serine/threonine protein kinase/tetratricopeptide (TPR) repeat protein
MDTDRNLLFGVLALQLDLIDRDAFVNACAAWATHKEQPLADVLMSLGLLTAEDRSEVERLLERRLKRHGGDVQASLAEAADSGVRSAVAAVGDEALARSLPPTPSQWMALSTVGPTTPDGARYATLRLAGTGGIGRVWLVRDGSLGREVALKELRPDRADPDFWGRFVREAQVTGQLEHPGIVPVYEVGRRPQDNQPFYTMRFVRGRTLKDAIAAYHQRRTTNEAGTLELRELLGAFVQVCQAVGYAHSRGVLHRDLKPHNVALGDYGEVMVLDWGLAKLLASSEQETGTSPAPPLVKPAVEQEPTQTGAILGTPQYMAPEQAGGRLDLIDARTDVYGLGAILYHLLTGEPPFGGRDTPEVLGKVLGDPPRRPRELVGDTPRVLEAVCLKALAKKREDRYPSARALAEEVQRWLADQPVTAYRDPLTVRLTRWARRHRTAVTTAAALLLTAALALGVGLVAVNAEKNNTARAKQATEQALAQITEEQGRTKEALAQVTAAQKATAQALEQVTAEKGRTQEALVAKAAALESSEKAEKSAKVQRQLALKTVRNVVSDIHARLKDRPAQQELRKALLGRALAGLAEVARAADTATAVDHETIGVHFELGDIFLEIEAGGTAEAKKQYDKAHALAQQVWEADRESAQAQRDLSVSHGKLGDVHRRLGDSKAALEHYKSCQALQERLAEADKTSAQAQRDLSVSHSKLGDVQLELGDSKAALDSYQKALEVSQRLADADKASARAQRYLSVSHNRLGDVYLQLGDSKAALDSYQKGLEVNQRLADADRTSAQAQRDLSVSHEKLGDVQLELGDSKAALDSYKKALEVRQRLADADKTSALAQRDLSVSHIKLGDVQLRLGDSKAALDSYQKALEVSQRLADADKASALAQRDLAASHNRLGDVYLQLGDSKAALDSYKKGLEVSQRLAEADRTSAQAQRDLSVSHEKLGDVQLELGDSKAALDSYQKALEVSQRLADADKTSAQAQRDLIVGHFKLGNAAQQTYDYRAAQESYGRALDIPKRFSRPEVFQQEVTDLEARIRFCHAAEQAVADPASALKQPADLRQPVLVAAMLALARKEKQPARAAAAADLLADNAKGSDDLYNAACGHALCVSLADKPEMKEKYAARAVELLRKAVAKGYKDAAQMKKDADLDALRQRDDFQKLLADLEAAPKPKENKEP